MSIILTGEELARLPAMHRIATQKLDEGELTLAIEELLKAQVDALMENLIFKVSSTGVQFQSIASNEFRNGTMVFIPDEEG